MAALRTHPRDIAALFAVPAAQLWLALLVGWRGAPVALPAICVGSSRAAQSRAMMLRLHWVRHHVLHLSNQVHQRAVKLGVLPRRLRAPAACTASVRCLPSSDCSTC